LEEELTRTRILYGGREGFTPKKEGFSRNSVGVVHREKQEGK